MQSNDARILRGAAIPTALTGLIGVGVSGAVVGGQGALGAVVGTVLVLLFFTAGLHGLGVVGRKWPELLMGAGLLVYTTQIFALLIALFIFRDADYLNGRALGFTALACALVWPAAQAWMQTRVKTLYVDTDGPSADGGKGSDA